MKHSKTLSSLLTLVALTVFSPLAGAITADLHLKLKPVLEKIDLVTDINQVGDSLFVCTQPGLLLRKNLNSLSTTDAQVFLDLRPKVGRLGSRIPALPGLGYPTPGTYDERGLLGFVAAPSFDTNGLFWVWYTNINQHSASPPYFFQWQVSTSGHWDTSQYDNVSYLDEYQVVAGVPQFRRTLLKIKRPYFNHTGFQSLVWSPELHTLVLGLGDGGSEYDPNNIAQDNRQLSGKLLKIDLAKLKGLDFRNSPPVATFADLQAQNVPEGAFTVLVKGLRNPSKVHFERVADANASGGFRWIKYLANTGQDTIEFVHGFDRYGLNFGFRAWEGIFPTAFEGDGDTRTIAYGLEASRMPNFYRPLVEYTHLDPTLEPNANTGSALYRGNRIAGLKGQLVFTDWISFSGSRPHGLLMHAGINRSNLQRAQAVKLVDVDLSSAGLSANQPIFYTAINTDPAGERIFIGGFKDIQYITNQRDHPFGSDQAAGALYEVVPK